MLVYVADYKVYAGKVTITELNREYVVVDVPAVEDFYLVEGYLDLSNMDSDDSVEVKEYISVDGENLKPYSISRHKDVQEIPIIRFHTKTMRYQYRITINQLSGIGKTYPYWIIVEIMEKK